LDFEVRERVLQDAKKIAEAAKYLGAGTVEFLVQDGEHYFLEMNTRLQVEHPVTELVYSIDLVKAQIMTAQGQSLLWDQEELEPRGHSIECRIYAEDPYQNGMPSIGVLGDCHWPSGPGRRFDVGFECGDEVTSFYDSMIAKVIVWDESRPRAIRKMRRTLQDSIVFGLDTNIPFLLEILSHEEFVSGKMSTLFLQQHFPEGLKEDELTPEQEQIAKLVSEKLQRPQAAESQGPNPWFSSWS
jgi:acetyl/propionyl-CoA carboxylase alpha subunit